MKLATTNHIDHEREPEPEKVTVVQAETTQQIATQSIVENGPARISSHTILAILAVNMIYLAQLINLVGAGAQAQTIAAHMGQPDKSVWILGPVTMMTVSFGPIVSQAADFWGRKWLLVVLTVIGGVGCLIVALSNSMGMVIAGFTVLGITYGSQPLLHAITSEVLPRRLRAVGQATIMISNSLGSAIALIIGGLLNRTSDSTSNGFRYFYYMTMACFFLGAVLCVLSYHPAPREKQGLPLAEKLANLDWGGYVLLAVGLCLFYVALSWSNNPYSWSDPHVCATFALGVITLIALAGYETRFKKDGMFHHALFTYSGNKNFAICLICVFTEGSAFFAVNSHLAFQISTLYETDALIVGVRYTIAFITAAIGAYAAGLYCAKFKRARWITVSAFAIFVIFFVCMATGGRTSSKPVWGYPAMMGIGLGMTLTTLVTIAQLSTPPDLIAIATGLMLSFRAVGGTVGLTCYNAMFSSKLSSLGSNIAQAVIPAGFPQRNLGELIGALVTHNQTALAAVPGINAAIIERATTAYLDTFVDGFRSVWIAGGCFVAATGIVAVFLVDRVEDFNMHVDAPLEIEEYDQVDGKKV